MAWLVATVFALAPRCWAESRGRRLDRATQEVNRKICSEKSLHWDVLDPEASASMLRKCGIIFWGRDTLDPDQSILETLNSSAHDLLASAPRSYRIKPDMNRDGREALIPPHGGVFDRDLMRRLVASPLGETLRNYFGVSDPGLNYVELWWAPVGVKAQEIHTDGSGGGLIVFWLLDDLGGMPRRSGEFLAIPGCFNPPDAEASAWCKKVEDKRANRVNFTAIDMQHVLQPHKAGSGFVYDTNLLHAGMANLSPRIKLAFTISVHGRSARDLEVSEMERMTVKESYGRKAQAANAAWQRDWDSVIQSYAARGGRAEL